MESCGTRGTAPFDVVVTHGFTLDEDGRKMSKSLGNTVAPQDVIKQSGADILRLWVASCDYWDDQRIGPEILKTTIETYRKLRNTIRWMLGSLAHFHDDDRVAVDKMPELERLMLHRLAELDRLVRQSYADFDYKRIFAALNTFMTVDLSAFYFDIRKDTLYCDPISSMKRRACLTVLDHLFRATVTWLAPMLPFTTEEAWLSRFPSADGSVHLELFPEIPAAWRNDALAEKWRKVRNVRRVVTGALEIERAAKRIGSSLEADPIVHVSDPDLFGALVDIDLAEVCITSAATLVSDEGPATAFRLPDVPGRRRRHQSRRGHEVRALLENLAGGRQRSGVSRRDAARRAGAARMGHHARPSGAMSTDRSLPDDGAAHPQTNQRFPLVWGPLSRLGLATAAIIAVADQTSKLWLLFVFDLQARGIVRVTPFFDLVLIWNKGISYGLFQQDGPLGQWALLALTAIAVALLWMWLARATSRLTAAVDRPDRGRGDRQRHRPHRLRRGGGFRPAAPDYRKLQLQMVRVQSGRCGHRCRGGRSVV